MLEAGAFAQSFVGQYLIPFLVVTTSSLVIGGFGAVRKLLKQGSVAAVAAADAKKAVANLDEKVDQRLTGQDVILKEVVGQLRTNGGSSLKDAVNRAEFAANQNGEALKSLRTEFAAADERIDKKLTEHLMYSATKTAEIETKMHYLGKPPA